MIKHQFSFLLSFRWISAAHIFWLFTYGGKTNALPSVFCNCSRIRAFLCIDEYIKMTTLYFYFTNFSILLFFWSFSRCVKLKWQIIFTASTRWIRRNSLKTNIKARVNRFHNVFNFYTCPMLANKLVDWFPFTITNAYALRNIFFFSSPISALFDEFFNIYLVFFITYQLIPMNLVTFSSIVSAWHFTNGK